MNKTREKSFLQILAKLNKWLADRGLPIKGKQLVDTMFEFASEENFEHLIIGAITGVEFLAGEGLVYLEVDNRWYRGRRLLRIVCQSNGCHVEIEGDLPGETKFIPGEIRFFSINSTPLQEVR